MAIKLKDDDEAKVPYSKTERVAFSALPKGNPKSTSEILDKFYGGEVPYHGRNVLNSLIRSLSKKISINQEPFRIEKSKRRGPHPTTVRVVHRSDEA